MERRRSVPELDLSVPAAGDHLRRLVRMPERADAHFIMRLDPVIELRRLPVPDIQLPVSIAGHHVTATTTTTTLILQTIEQENVHCHKNTATTCIIYSIEPMNNLHVYIYKNTIYFFQAFNDSKYTSVFMHYSEMVSMGENIISNKKSL